MKKILFWIAVMLLTNGASYSQEATKVGVKEMEAMSLQKI
jgi:hypothetical protein